MTNKRTNRTYGIDYIRIFLIGLMLTSFAVSCKKIPDSNAIFITAVTPGPHPDSVWLSWNLLFTPSYTEDSIGKILQAYENYISSYVTQLNPALNVIFYPHICPCDKLLINLDVTIVGGSGNSVPPPPTKPQPGPTGEYILDDNDSIQMPEVIGHDTTIEKKITLANFPSIDNPDNRVLAIIDTGLDTTLFNPPIQKLLWDDTLTSTGTIYNVLPYESTHLLIDNNNVKHGTNVMALALNEIRNGRLPRVMPVRAFDEHANGSIYTVSCAMSYAIQRHATIINASFGYYGKEDSVLRHYLRMARDSSIAVIAAAGNTKGHHDATLICSDSVNAGNLLGSPPPFMFYPGSYANTMDNVISVTSLKLNSDSHELTPCFYQNYSEQYVSVGVYNRVDCCSFNAGLLHQPVEGSSFATPVVTGFILANSRDIQVTNMRDFIDLRSNLSSGRHYTRNGNYISYP